MIRSGISMDQVDGATFSLSTGAEVAGFGVSRLGNRASVRRVFKASAGAVVIDYDYAADVDVGFIGMIHHNAEATATYRHQLYDASAVEVYDSGVLDFYPGAAETDAPYRQNTPHALPAATTARAGKLTLSAHTTGWVMGVLDVSSLFWEWSDVQVPREFGLRNGDGGLDTPGGSHLGIQQFSPRIVSGTRGVLDFENDDDEDTIRRWMQAYGIDKPFSWVWDIDDPETWPREHIWVHNASIVPYRRDEFPAGSFSFRFEEELS